MFKLGIYVMAKTITKLQLLKAVTLVNGQMRQLEELACRYPSASMAAYTDMCFLSLKYTRTHLNWLYTWSTSISPFWPPGSSEFPKIDTQYTISLIANLYQLIFVDTEVYFVIRSESPWSHNANSLPCQIFWGADCRENFLITSVVPKVILQDSTAEIT